MSRQLAITSALSVMAMATLVLFSTPREGAFAPGAGVTMVATPQLSGLQRMLAGD